MNFVFKFYYFNKKVFDEMIPLLMDTFEGADYLVESCGLNEFSPFVVNSFMLKVRGSQKAEFKTLKVDLDNILDESDINIDKLEYYFLDNSLHYWYFAGAIQKSFADLSTAYFTGYFMKHDKKIELEIFGSAPPIPGLEVFHQK